MAYSHIVPLGALWLIFPQYHFLWIPIPAIALPVILRHRPTLRRLMYPLDIADEDAEKGGAGKSPLDVWPWKALLLLPRRMSRPMGDRANPVLVRELRYERLQGANWFRSLMPGAFLVSLAGALWFVVQQKQDAMWFILATATLFLIVPTIGAPSIVREFEQSTFDSLAVTTLRPISMIWPRIYLAVRTGLISLAILSMGFVPVVAFHHSGEFHGLLGGYAVIVCSIVLLSVVSVFCSAIAKSSAQALVMAYGAGAALLGGTPLACHALRIHSDVDVGLYGWIALGGPTPAFLGMAKSPYLGEIVEWFGLDFLVLGHCVFALGVSVVLFLVMVFGFDYFWKKGPLRKM